MAVLVMQIINFGRDVMTRIYKWGYLSSIMMLCLTLNAAAKQLQSNPTIDSDEYLIYSTVLRALTNHDKMIVMRESTLARPLNDFEIQKVKSETRQPLTAEMLEDFQRKNARLWKLSSKRLKLGNNVHLLDDKSYQEMRKKGQFWSQFAERFPAADTLVSISRVGFDAKKGEAIIYLDTAKGNLAGEGVVLRLVKRDGEWKVKFRVSVLVAFNYRPSLPATKLRRVTVTILSGIGSARAALWPDQTSTASPANNCTSTAECMITAIGGTIHGYRARRRSATLGKHI